MKVTLYANVSANGKVLLSENPNHQVPEAVLGLSMQNINRAGNLVMGRKSFEYFIAAFGGIDKVREVLPDVELVLLSTTNPTTTAYKVVNDPEDAIAYLGEKGLNEIIVGGGTETYNAFLEKGLITDVVFNIIPTITAGGILGTNDALNIKFKLVGHQLLSDDIIQLRYSNL